MLSNKEIRDHFSLVIKNDEDRERLYKLLYELTGDKDYILGNLVLPKLGEKNIDRVEWTKFLETVKNKYEEDGEWYTYQAYIIALIYSKTHISITDLGKVRINRSVSQSENSYTVSTGVFDFKEGKKYRDKHYKLECGIKEAVDLWLNKYNLTDSFIVNKAMKSPSDGRNYITKVIFKEFDFPRIK